MQVFNLPCTWEVSGTIQIRAYDLEDAVERAESRVLDLPEDGAPIPGTLRIDEDRLFELD